MGFEINIPTRDKTDKDKKGGLIYSILSNWKVILLLFIMYLAFFDPDKLNSILLYLTQLIRGLVIG